MIYLAAPTGATGLFVVAAILAGLAGPGTHGRWRSRVRGAEEVGGEFPAVVMAEEILKAIGYLNGTEPGGRVR